MIYHQGLVFPGGRRASAVTVPIDVDGEDLLAALDLPEPKGSVILNGSSAPLPPELARRLREVLCDGVAQMVLADGLTAVTGATDAGVFSLFGRAMASSTAPLVGVAPAGAVTWPGDDRRSQISGELIQLEPNHSHFVLVNAQEWSAETQALLALASALGERAPSACVICGGGAGTRLETLGHARAGRGVVLVAGSGRFTDELVAVLEGRTCPAEPDVEEMAACGTWVVCELSGGPEPVAQALRRLLAHQADGSDDSSTPSPSPPPQP